MTKNAPRILKDPVSCRFSSLRKTGTPARSRERRRLLDRRAPDRVPRGAPRLERRASAGTSVTTPSPRGAAPARCRPRTRSARAGASAAVRPATETGGRTSTVAVVRWKTIECLGSAVSVPEIASGTMSTPRSMARRNAPSRNGASCPSALRVPSGKTTTELFSRRRWRMSSIARRRASLVAARQRDVAGEPHLPAEDPDPEDVVLGKELHLPGQHREEPDVGHRTVIRNEQVRALRVGMHRVHDVEVPERVQTDADDAGVAQDASDAVASRIGVPRQEPEHAHERSPEKDDEDVGEPPQVGQRNRERAQLVETPARFFHRRTILSAE